MMPWCKTLKSKKTLRSGSVHILSHCYQPVCSGESFTFSLAGNRIPKLPFFESLTKKPPASMNDLFRRMNKYVMLKDDVRTISQQILVTNRPAKNNKARNSNPLNNQSRQGGWRQWQPLRFTLLTISYEKLLLLIWELSEFKWLEPIKNDST